MALPFGAGFTSISAPSGAGRMYARGTANQNTVIELTFQGKLRGRANPETFLGRLIASGPLGAQTSTPDRLLEDAKGNLSPNVFMPLPAENELLQEETGQSGVYRASGVEWVRDQPISLVQNLNGAITDLIIPKTAVYDQQTGMISSDTKFGGKVFLDPTLGTVRFTGGTPGRNAQLFLSYTPRFLRISKGGAAGYTDPVGLFDGRLITDPSFWRTATGQQADYNTTATDGSLLSSDRMIFTYNRAASGAGQTAQPYVKTMRFGVRLPYPIATNTDGSIATPLTVTGTSPYQVDPTQDTGAAVYFPESAEGSQVSVTQTVVDANGHPQIFTTTAIISLITERDEAALPIETSINESGLVPFLDPFSYLNAGQGGVFSRRPPLVYLIWSSTRYGSPDLFFESIAPRWTPIVQGG
jgi:hypothetical protein